MPTSPIPLHFSCPACGWHKTTRPASDAVVHGVDYFRQCPHCSYHKLDSRRASLVEKLAVNIRR
ncbi:hypothetical protein [Kushneria aurantia]|uniref:Uncharacterized protein n=1 Tax=Kushneria aurantia TaxID=504092 RepID=A0ABV6G3Z0_9GAMM|nr:hypothetical protein [Kushneria aurantia]